MSKSNTDLLYNNQGWARTDSENPEYQFEFFQYDNDFKYILTRKGDDIEITVDWSSGYNGEGPPYLYFSKLIPLELVEELCERTKTSK